MVAIIRTRNLSSPTITPPSGWTLLDGPRVFGNGNRNTVWTYWKIAGSSEPISYTWAVGGTVLAYDFGIIHTFSVNDQITPINASAFAVSTSLTPPQVATTVPNTQLLSIILTDEGDTATRTTLPPSGESEVYSRHDVASSLFLEAGRMSLGSAGATSLGAYTTGALSFSALKVTIAVVPASPTLTSVLGYDTMGASASSMAAGRMLASKFTLATAGVLNELHGWFNQGAGETVRLVIYKSDANISGVVGAGNVKPGTRVAYTSPLSIGGTTPIHAPESGFNIALPAGDYWIGVRSSGTVGQTRGTNLGVGGFNGINSGTPDPPPDPFGNTDTGGSNTLSVWAVVAAPVVNSDSATAPLLFTPSGVDALPVTLDTGTLGLKLTASSAETIGRSDVGTATLAFTPSFSTLR